MVHACCQLAFVSEGFLSADSHMFLPMHECRGLHTWRTWLITFILPPVQSGYTERSREA